VYEPAITRFPTDTVGTPSVRTGLVEDVYLTIVASSPDDPEAEIVTLGVRVNPLVLWLWVGAAIMLAGTALAAWPGRPLAKRSRPPTAATTEPPETKPALDRGEPRAPVPAGDLP
jgi:cytochrome c-type biogenesis protein CcmF